MSTSNLQQVLLWCVILNYFLLIVWWVIFLFPHKWIYALTSKAFRVSEEKFDSYNLAGLIFYKLGIVLFFLVPYVAIRIAG